MRLFKGQKSKPSGARYRWAAIGLAALALAVGASFAREAVRTRQIDREIAELKSESERLRAKNFEIASMRSTLGQTEFAEKEARLKLGLRKEGEQVVVIQPSPKATVDESASVAVVDDLSNPTKWWLYFMDHKKLEAYGPARPEQPATIE